jgi:hypothetical protein
MVHNDKALMRRARQRGKYRFYAGGGESIEIGGAEISGPMVVVVTRSRVEIIPMSYRDSIPRFSWSAQNA